VRNYFCRVAASHPVYFRVCAQTQNIHGYTAAVTFDCRRDGVPQAQRRSNPFLLASLVVLHVRLVSRDSSNSRSRGGGAKGGFRRMSRGSKDGGATRRRKSRSFRPEQVSPTRHRIFRVSCHRRVCRTEAGKWA